MISSFRGRHSFLSNFHPCRIEMGGMVYSSVEHAYQAAKTDSQQQRDRIRLAKTPGEAKRLGRKVQLRPGWESMKIDVMYVLLHQKFRLGSTLADALITTSDEELVEGNTWGDTFWGVCRGIGRNELGELLMKIRDELKTKNS